MRAVFYLPATTSAATMPLAVKLLEAMNGFGWGVDMEGFGINFQMGRILMFGVEDDDENVIELAVAQLRKRWYDGGEVRMVVNRWQGAQALALAKEFGKVRGAQAFEYADATDADGEHRRVERYGG